MARISLQAPPVQTFELVDEVFMGGPPGDDDQSGRRATVGRPVPEKVGPQDLRDDKEALAFLEGSDFDFYKMYLTCSLGAGPRDEIEEATVRINFAAEHDDAVAWSLSPLRLVQRVQLDTLSLGADITLGPMLKIRGDWAPVTEQERCYVYALGEGEPDPEWRYRRTPNERLLGVHKMTMIIQIPRNRDAEGTLEITARLRHQGIWKQTMVPLPTDFAHFQVGSRSVG